MEIIKGMAMPPKKRLRNSRYALADQMEVGDCIIVPNLKEVSVLYHRLTRAGFKAASRQLDDGTIGVWRTE